MTDKQIKEINEQIKKAIQRIENIWEKYDELREKYKAKEQECEELIKNYFTVIQQRNVAEKQLNQLKIENDECIKDNEYLKTIIKDVTQEVVKLKATLQEIKELCGIGIVNGLSEEQYLSELRDWQAQILQKISECEVLNE